MKASLLRNVPADRAALARALGRLAADGFVPNPRGPSVYALVLVFPNGSGHVVTAHTLRKALRRAAPRGSLLIVGYDLTEDARAMARAVGADVATQRQFGWTDESWERIRALC